MACSTTAAGRVSRALAPAPQGWLRGWLHRPWVAWGTRLGCVSQPLPVWLLPHAQQELAHAGGQVACGVHAAGEGCQSAVRRLCAAPPRVHEHQILRALQTKHRRGGGCSSVRALGWGGRQRGRAFFPAPLRLCGRSTASRCRPHLPGLRWKAPPAVVAAAACGQGAFACPECRTHSPCCSGSPPGWAS